MTAHHPPAWPRRNWSEADYDNWAHDDRRTVQERNALNNAARVFQDWLNVQAPKVPTAEERRTKAHALADEYGAAYGPMSYYAATFTP